MYLFNHVVNFIMYLNNYFYFAGYGNIYPRTPEGKIATIVYAIIGMPLFLLYLSNIGDIMARSFKWIYAKCCLCRCCPGVAKRRAIRKIRREQKMQADYDSDEEASEISSESIEVSTKVLNIYLSQSRCKI